MLQKRPYIGLSAWHGSCFECTWTSLGLAQFLSANNINLECMKPGFCQRLSANKINSELQESWIIQRTSCNLSVDLFQTRQNACPSTVNAAELLGKLQQSAGDLYSCTSKEKDQSFTPRPWSARLLLAQQVAYLCLRVPASWYRMPWRGDKNRWYTLSRHQTNFEQ